MQTEVFRRLHESSSSPVFWTATDVKAALNDGLEEISDSTEWYERQTTMNLWSGRTYQSLLGILPETTLAVRRIFNNQTNRWLIPEDVRDLDERTYVQWENNQGEPQRWLIRGLWWLGIWPKPNGDSGTLRLYASSIPAAMSADSDEPAFPKEYHQGLIEYALYDLLAQDGESKLALGRWQAYLVFEEGLRQYVEGRQKIDKVRVLRQ